MVRVYRYEHPKDTFGPYRFRGDFGEELNERFDKMNDHHCDSNEHETIYRWDVLHGLGYTHEEIRHGVADDVNFKYGCVTLEDLNRWFDGYHDLLHEAGFVLATYDVPEGEVTKPDPFGQVAFVSSH